MADVAVHSPPPAGRPSEPGGVRDRTTSRPPLARIWSRVRGWPPWQQVLLAYACSRLLTAAIIAGAARLVQNPAGVGDLHPDYLDLVVIWDGQWYRQIAERGYPDGLPLNDLGQVDYNSWAFFPLFPMLVRGLMALGLPFSTAATLVNVTAGAAAAVVLFHLLAGPRHDGDARRGGGRVVGGARERLAVLGVATWCLLPPAAVLQVAYTEALAALLLATSLLLLVRRRYGWAVPVVLLLGVTRAVAAPLLVVVAWHAVARWRSAETVERGEWLRLGALAVVTGGSALLWPAVVGLSTGVPDAFFRTQAVWGQDPGSGPFVPWFTWSYDRAGVVGVLLLLGAVAALVSVVLGPHGAWLSAELRVWAVVYPLYLLAVVRPITSMWRFLLLDLPLAAVIASVVVRETSLGRPVSPHWRWRVAAVALAAVAAMSWWVGVLLTRTPWNDSPP
ncbi:MAG TPA: hypothetical protein VF661_05725 [Actinomycetales bacterium]